MLGIKKFSWASFFIGAGAGFVLGVLILGISVNYLVSRAISNDPISGMAFSAAIAQIRAGIAQSNAEKETKSVYGHVVSIGKGTLVLEVAQTEGRVQYTFEYDNSTTFVYLANDAASSEVPLSADTITPGTGLNVMTNEAVGSVPNQHAVKVIKI